MVLTRAFLNADHIESREIRSEKEGDGARRERLSNRQQHLYPLLHSQSRPRALPDAPASGYELLAPQTAISLVNLRGTQLGRHFIESLGPTKDLPVPVASAQFLTEDLAPGETTLGVIVLRSQFPRPACSELCFPMTGFAMSQPRSSSKPRCQPSPKRMHAASLTATLTSGCGRRSSANWHFAFRTLHGPERFPAESILDRCGHDQRARCFRVLYFNFMRA